MVLDFLARGVDVLAYDFTARLGIDPDIEPMSPGTSDPSIVEAWQPTDIIVHMNPPLFAQVLAQFPSTLLSSVTLVGYWAWELTVVPPAWQVCAKFCDEIWTPSPFVAQAAMGGLQTFAGKIAVVPHAVGRDPIKSQPLSARKKLRAVLNLPADHFVVGTSFSFKSNYARKNPCAAIDAFRLSFRAGEQVCLLIHCNDSQTFTRLFDHLVSFAGEDPRIIILDTFRRAYPIRDFYGTIDLYLSLHRSEGYGLTLMEAAQAGLPVIATRWGMAPDIAARPEVHTVSSRLVVTVDSQGIYDRHPGAVWAEPDLFEAASELTQAYEIWSSTPSMMVGCGL